jgi:hypothetical protein
MITVLALAIALGQAEGMEVSIRQVAAVIVAAFGALAMINQAPPDDSTD